LDTLPAKPHNNIVSLVRGKPIIKNFIDLLACMKVMICKYRY